MIEDYPRMEIPADLHRKMMEAARQFRKEPTPSEKILWQALRDKKLDGIKFRRQQPIGPFVVDFYNSQYRLIIEVDGPIHDYQVEADWSRQENLEILGLIVLRLKAEMVESNLPKVLSLIWDKIYEIEQSSSPFWGEGRGGG